MSSDNNSVIEQIETVNDISLPNDFKDSIMKVVEGLEES